MQTQEIKVKTALNKAYLKEKVNRADIDLFKIHFADLLNKINDINQNTSHLETQIDQLVYQLYNLTPEEIKIVEGEV